MAAYNGSRFIEQQLESILPQLSSTDEIVVIDDCSQDETVDSIRRFNDSRIRLFTHGSNQGIVTTFEEALRRATGNILFLCDDDDLWSPTKVELVLREFETHPEVQVVTSKVALIDEDGFRLPDAGVNRHGNFANGFWRNIAMNHYQGSAMAIRANLLGTVLPFPRRRSFLHDVWIGTRNDIVGGRTAFIDEPLVYYRRHSHNASKKHNLIQQLRIRADLLIAHIARGLLRPDLRNSKSSFSTDSQDRRKLFTAPQSIE
jgi:glycosyltransferase involved in cell wall biosynthesis